MIARLKGKIEYLEDNWVIVDVNNVGYKVYVTDFTLGKLAGKTDVSLDVFTYVREDVLALYGFLEVSEKNMFELLISISGIGPKAAMSILSVADTKSIQAAVLNEDPSILTSVSGIGKKTAERVILELQNKIADLTSDERAGATSDSEVVEALMAMGYSASQSREALKNISKELNGVEDKIKAALKELGK